MIIAFQDTEIYLHCFDQFVCDRDMEFSSKADVRRAIVVYSNYIKNKLADFYGVDQQEGE